MDYRAAVEPVNVQIPLTACNPCFFLRQEYLENGRMKLEKGMRRRGSRASAKWAWLGYGVRSTGCDWSAARDCWSITSSETFATRFKI